MSILIADIFTVPIHDVPTMQIPSVCDGNAVERLKRIIYLARRYLTHRTFDEIKAACADALYLYQWFFENQAEQLRLDFSQQKINDPLLQYIDLEQYIEDSLLNLKLTYLSEVDVLHALPHQHKSSVLIQMDKLQSNFSHVEFFCALALYHASIAMTKIKESAANTGPMQNDHCPSTIEEIYDAILEAQVAIDHARQWSIGGQLEFSNLLDDFMQASRRAIAKKAHQARYGEKYKQRRTKAITLYEEGHYRSRLEAALYLIEPIQACSKELGIPLLNPDSARDTIYKWLSQYDNQISSDLKIK